MEYRRLEGSDESLEDTVRLLRRSIDKSRESLGKDDEADPRKEDNSNDVNKSSDSDHNARQIASRSRGLGSISSIDMLVATLSESEERLIDEDERFTVVNDHHDDYLPRRKMTSYLMMATVMAALGGVLFGYDIGIISGALLQLKEEFSLSCFEQEMVVSSMLIGATIGSIFGGFIIDRIGRRWAIVINSAVFIGGAVILAAAPSYPILVFGRLIVGFAVSLSAIGECIYISEIAPKERRGQLVSINELGITLGLLLAYLVNLFFIKVSSGWRYMFGLSALPALFQGLGMYALPPSPRFLVQRKRNEQAKRVLTKLRGTDQVAEELSSIQTSMSLERSYSILHLFQSVDNMRWRMLVGAGLVFLQQITGQTNVVYYAPLVLENLGFEDNFSATLATVGLGVVKVIATCACLLTVDRFGRRRFLLIGATLMAVFIITLGFITQVIPSSAIKSNCPVTSHSEMSANSSLLERHMRESVLISGDEVAMDLHSYHAHSSNFERSSDRSDRHSIFLQQLSDSNLLSDAKADSRIHSEMLSLRTKRESIDQDGEVFDALRRKREVEELTTTHEQTESYTTSFPGESTIHSNSTEGQTTLNLAILKQLSSTLGTKTAELKPAVTIAKNDPDSIKKESAGGSNSHFSPVAKWTALVSLIVYVGAYSFGFGPISWLVISEIFPVGIRGRASSITTVFNWGTNVIISLTFLDVMRKFGMSWTFLTYGFVCCLSVVFIYVAIPETKNRSLEQISEELSKRTSIAEMCGVCSRCPCCHGNPSSYRPTLLMTDDSIL